MNQPKISPYDNLYLLLEDYNCTVNGNSITVPEMFTFDGCSIPMFSLFRPHLITAALVHDWLYVSHQVTRKEADQIFKELLVKNGTNKLIASSMYQGLRIGGSFAWKYSKEDKQKLTELYDNIKDNEDFCSYCFPNILY